MTIEYIAKKLVSWKNRVMSQKIKYFGYFAFVVLGTFLFRQTVFGADAASTGVFGGAESFTDVVLNFISMLMMAAAKACLQLLTFVLTFVIEIASYNGYLNSTAVNTGWVMVRDLTNMMFVVALLAIAFGTILGIEHYEWKHMLFKLVSAAVMVNFSRIICGVIIDIAQVVMVTFINGIASTLGGNFIRAFNLEKIQSFQQNVAGGQINSFSVWLSAAGALFISVTVLVAMVAFLFMLVARMIVLWVLIVLSPVAFVFGVLHQTEHYAGEWWSYFGKNVITGPVLIFFLWLTLVTVGSGVVNQEIRQSVPQSLADPAEFDTGISQTLTGENLINFAIAIGMLLVGLQTTQHLGGIGAEWAGQASDYGKKAAMVLSGAALARSAAQKSKDYAVEKAKGAWDRNIVAPVQEHVGVAKTKLDRWRNDQSKDLTKDNKKMVELDAKLARGDINREEYDKEMKKYQGVGAAAGRGIKGIIARAMETSGRGDKRAKDRRERLHAEQEITEEEYSISSEPVGQRKLKSLRTLEVVEHRGHEKKAQKAAEMDLLLQKTEGIDEETHETKGYYGEVEQAALNAAAAKKAAEAKLAGSHALHQQQADEKFKVEEAMLKSRQQEELASARSNEVGADALERLQQGTKEGVMLNGRAGLELRTPEERNAYAAHLQTMRANGWIDQQQLQQAQNNIVVNPNTGVATVNPPNFPMPVITGSSPAEVERNAAAAKQRLKDYEAMTLPNGQSLVSPEESKRVAAAMTYQEQQAEIALRGERTKQVKEGTGKQTELTAAEAKEAISTSQDFRERETRLTAFTSEINQIQDKMTAERQTELLTAIRNLLESEVGIVRQQGIAGSQAVNKQLEESTSGTKDYFSLAERKARLESAEGRQEQEAIERQKAESRQKKDAISGIEAEGETGARRSRLESAVGSAEQRAIDEQQARLKQQKERVSGIEEISSTAARRGLMTSAAGQQEQIEIETQKIANKQQEELLSSVADQRAQEAKQAFFSSGSARRVQKMIFRTRGQTEISKSAAEDTQIIAQAEQKARVFESSGDISRAEATRKAAAVQVDRKFSDLFSNLSYDQRMAQEAVLIRRIESEPDADRRRTLQRMRVNLTSLNTSSDTDSARDGRIRATTELGANEINEGNRLTLELQRLTGARGVNDINELKRRFDDIYGRDQVAKKLAMEKLFEGYKKAAGRGDEFGLGLMKKNVDRDTGSLSYEWANSDAEAETMKVSNFGTYFAERAKGSADSVATMGGRMKNVGTQQDPNWVMNGVSDSGRKSIVAFHKGKDAREMSTKDMTPVYASLNAANVERTNAGEYIQLLREMKESMPARGYKTFLENTSNLQDKLRGAIPQGSAQVAELNEVTTPKPEQN